jgi:hypothetical protein
VAKAVDNNLPLYITAAAIGVRATTISVWATTISVWATIVAASVVRPAAYHRACRKTADKARTKSATTIAMPMLRLS